MYNNKQDFVTPLAIYQIGYLANMEVFSIFLK